MRSYQDNDLWRRSFVVRPEDPYAEPRRRLASSYDQLWNRGTAIARRISSDLPNLTLHDEAHLSALWDRVSQLIGQDYDINPLETYILGAAIVLHDAGHALAAYTGGLVELKQTVAYRDAVAYLMNSARRIGDESDDVTSSSEEIESRALFATLRRIHASQAEELATRSFGGDYIIHDDDIRHSLGQLIGRIATSHHWDRSILESKLPPIQGAPGSMPQDWRIQPVKLACLLRCADAIQIDERRTPRFSFTLHNPQGASRLHWIAQQLAQPIIVPVSDGPGALTFTSQADFTVEKADAWWIAYDLVRTANIELEGCYQLMRASGLQTFTVNRVAGAETPSALESYIRTDGWKPVSAEVRVTNVEHIIRLFGGVTLYGTDPAVPLRELVQNAADAVRARRELSGDHLFEGRILVQISHGSDGSARLLVFDNGIGMSERVLTGPLLEFGKSFWTSEEVQEEFPGLLGSGLAQSGRFGIGFFSTLAVSKQVIVTSRRFDASHETHSLSFRDGLTLRPLLLKADGSALGQYSTCVDLLLSSQQSKQLLTCHHHQGFDAPVFLNLRELLAHLCPCVDCDIYTRENSGSQTLAHPADWHNSDPLGWLRSILFADKLNDKVVDGYLKEAASRLRVLKGPNGLPNGRAAIGFGLIGAGVNSINGLNAGDTTKAMMRFSQAHIGAIGQMPQGPSRFTGVSFGPEADMNAWATEQASLLIGDERKGVKYVAAHNVAFYGGDPIEIAVILVNRALKNIEEVWELLARGETIFAPIVAFAPGSQPEISSLRYRVRSSALHGLRDAEIEFTVPTMEPIDNHHLQGRTYNAIPLEPHSTRFSFLSCLRRYAAKRDRKLDFDLQGETVFGRYVGMPSERENMTVGMSLTAPALKIVMP